MGYRSGIRSRNSSYDLWLEVILGKAANPADQREEVDIKDSQVPMSSNISVNKLGSYRLSVLIYSWQQAD